MGVLEHGGDWGSDVSVVDKFKSIPILRRQVSNLALLRAAQVSVKHEGLVQQMDTTVQVMK